MAQVSETSTATTATTASDDSCIDHSKVYVAVPATTKRLSSNYKNQLNESNQFVTNNANSPKLSSPNKFSKDGLIDNKKILQSIFFKTSTPITERKNRNRILADTRDFPSTTIITGSKSFKEISSSTFPHKRFTNSLDSRRPMKQTGRESNGFLEKASNDKRIFLSLYNLTCTNLFDIGKSSPAKNNPTNIFFSSTASYASLKETDIDTGTEINYPIYKETNLDQYKRFSNNSTTTGNKTKSLGSLTSTSRRDNTLTICEDLDENLLNGTLPMTDCMRSLYCRLRNNAKHPSQMRIAKSITRLNIPVWLDSVDFSEKVYHGRSSQNLEMNNYDAYREIGTEKPVPKPKPKGIARKLQSMPLTKKSKEPVDNLTNKAFDLPSRRYYQNQTKLDQISTSKAREALNAVKLTKSTSSPASSTSSPAITALDLGKDSMKRLCNEFLQSVSGQMNDYLNYRNQIRIQEKGLKKCCFVRCLCPIKATITIDHYHCDDCSFVYCSPKCRSLNLPKHENVCKHEILVGWLNSIVDKFDRKQLSMLIGIDRCGRNAERSGFILWKCNLRNPSHQMSLNFIKSVENGAKTDCVMNGNDPSDQELILMILCVSNSGCTTVSVKRYLKYDLSNSSTDNNSRSSSSGLRTTSLKLSKCTQEERQTFVDTSVELLRKYNVNIQEQYPSVYFRLVEYVYKGCLFSNQSIDVVDKNTGLRRSVLIVPDELPQIRES